MLKWTVLSVQKIQARLLSPSMDPFLVHSKEGTGQTRSKSIQSQKDESKEKEGA